MTKPTLLDSRGREWVPYVGGLYKRKNHPDVYTYEDISYFWGPLTEKKPRPEDVVATLTCPECDETMTARLTLKKIDDHTWETRLVRENDEKGKRAHRCEVPPMKEPEVGTLVTVGEKRFVRTIRKGVLSTHDWINLEEGRHVCWQDILNLGNPSLGYYDNTLEY